MDRGKAIFFGLALIALVILAANTMSPVQAGLMGSGRYMGVAGSKGRVWVVDTETGKVKRCSPGFCVLWSTDQQ